jgi:hypothetical protein
MAKLRRLLLVAALAAAALTLGCRDKSSSSDKPGKPASAGAPTASPAGPGHAPAGSHAGKAAPPPAHAGPRPVIERAEPPAPPAQLHLAIELDSDNPFVGEPLGVRLYLSSPRADAMHDAAKAKAAPAPAAETPLSAVSADWPAQVRFALFQTNGGQTRPAGAELDWTKLRLPGSQLARGNPLAEWEIPASANLPAGEYLLRATWACKVPAGQDLTAETSFRIDAPQTNQDKAEHAERMSLLAYRQGRFADARRLADEAVKADPQSTTPRRFEMLLNQADSCLAMDDFKAGLVIYRSILKMPLDDPLNAELNQKVKLLEKLVAKQK